MWTVSFACLVVSCIKFNVIAFPVSLASLLAFIGAWLWISYRPWYRFVKACVLTCKGIHFCYHRELTAQERVQAKLAVESIQQKIENKLGLSKVCIIDDAFDGLIAILADDIDEKYFNAKYGTSYKKLYGFASENAIVVDIGDGIEKSALRHELAHIILDKCSMIKGTSDQHVTMEDLGV